MISGKGNCNAKPPRPIKYLVKMFLNKAINVFTCTLMFSRNSNRVVGTKGMCEQFSKARLFEGDTLLSSDNEETSSVVEFDQEEVLVESTLVLHNQVFTGIEDKLKNLNVVTNNATQSVNDIGSVHSDSNSVVKTSEVYSFETILTDVGKGDSNQEITYSGDSAIVKVITGNGEIVSFLSCSKETAESDIVGEFVNKQKTDPFNNKRQRENSATESPNESVTNTPAKRRKKVVMYS